MDAMQEEEVLVQQHLSINTSRAAERRPTTTAPAARPAAAANPPASAAATGGSRFQIPRDSPYAGKKNNELHAIVCSRCQNEAATVKILKLTSLPNTATKEALFTWLCEFDDGKARIAHG